MKRAAILLSVVLIGAGAWSARPAKAVEPEDDTQALKVRTAAAEFDAGRRAYMHRDYKAAAEHFENAFRDVPTVEALRLAIRAQRQSGNLARAATLAQLALRRYPEDRGTTALAQQMIRELTPKLIKVDVYCEPECSLVVDEHAVFEENTEELSVFLLPGEHSVSATWSDERVRTEHVQGEAGEQKEMRLRAPEKAPPPPIATALPAASSVSMPAPEPPPPEPKAPLSPTYFYVSAGLTAALTGVTIWSAIDTHNNPGKSRVEAACLDKGESCSEYQDGLSRQHRTNVLLGTSLGLAAVSTVVGVFFTDWSSKAASPSVGKSPSTLQWQPALSFEQGFQCGALGRF